MEEEMINDTDARDLLANIEQTEEMAIDAISYSLRQGGDFVKEDHIRWLMDTVDAVALAKKFFIRESSYAGDILSLAADVTEECAESCETFFEDEMMKNCAEVCRNCAQSCRKVLEEEEEDEIEDEETSPKPE